MSAPGPVVAERLSAGGIELELVRWGAGRPVRLLHGPQTVDPRARFLDLLGRRAEILAPSHPGFGHSPRPADLETVYDLVRLYLDVLEALPYEKVTLVGLSFGGWLAAEIAVTCCHRIDRLVLVDALGIKISDRETPDILDVFDLVRKALTHQEGPFSWEGKHYTHRHVNIWPRPWQQPHPRLWAATGDPETASEVGRRGMINVLVLRGVEGTKRAWAAYRSARAEAGLPKVTTDHFAYAAFVYVGDTHEEGVRVGSKLLWFLNTSLKSAPQYARFLPGTVPPQLAPQVYRTAPGPSAGARDEAARPANAEKPIASASQNAATLIGMTAEQAMERGILFVGNPDTVYRQIMDFYDKVGGFGHLVLVGRTGFMTHAEAEKGIKLFSKEVMPRLREIAPVTVG